MPNAYGRLPRTPDRRDFRARPALAYTGAYVSLEDRFPDPWDQGNLGSCVAFGTAAAAVYARRKAGLAELDPSQLFLYFAARERAGYPTNEDTGLQIRDGFASLANDGLPPAVDWPYVIEAFAERPPDQAYADARLDEALVYGAVGADGVDAMISSGYPVVIGFDVFESFESEQVADTGVMPVPERGESQVGGHCVVLVSTPRDGQTIPGAVDGTLYRRARNSWGTWGDHGWFWYPLPAMQYASDFWQVTTIGSLSPPIPPSPGEPTAEARALAKALHGSHGWVDNWHYGQTGKVAKAARAWLKSEGL